MLQDLAFGKLLLMAQLSPWFIRYLVVHIICGQVTYVKLVSILNYYQRYVTIILVSYYKMYFIYIYIYIYLSLLFSFR